VDLGNLRKIKKPNFTDFTIEMLLMTCIFSGCDYLDSIKGIGFVRAQKLVEQSGEDDTVSLHTQIFNTP
jgi:exonuclease-1